MRLPVSGQARRDRRYSPSTTVPSLGAYLANYRLQTERCRVDQPLWSRHRYGDADCCWVDHYPAAARSDDATATDVSERRVALAPSMGSPAVVFVHGGNWCSLSADDSAFFAAPLLRRGVSFFAVNYGLAPAHALPSIVGMVEQALRWIRAHAEDLGVDPARLVVVGTSAGAHLAAESVLRNPAPGPDADFAGLVLLSGIYDLRPICRTYVNATLRLSRDQARALSPLRLTRSPRIPVALAVGERETVAFRHQHRAFSLRLSMLRADAMAVTVPGRNHFDLPYELADPAGVLGATLGRFLDPICRSRPPAAQTVRREFFSRQADAFPEEVR
jgi:arylformamidase